LGGYLTGKGRSAQQHGIEYGAQAIDVSPLVDWFTGFGLFRRHIGGDKDNRIGDDAFGRRGG
jgi:hypothetical protein